MEMLRRQRNYDIDMSVNKLKTSDDVISTVLFDALRAQATARVYVGNVEPHEEKRGDMRDNDISDVNNKMFQFDDIIISSTGSARRRE